MNFDRCIADLVFFHLAPAKELSTQFIGRKRFRSQPFATPIPRLAQRLAHSLPHRLTPWKLSRLRQTSHGRIGLFDLLQHVAGRPHRIGRLRLIPSHHT